MSATHISIRDLLCLNVLVQFLLTIFQTHCDIGRALGPPEEIKVIARTLALVERRYRSEEPILALKSNGSVLKCCCFLTWRIRFSAKRASCLPGALTCFWRLIAQKKELRLSKLEIVV